MNHHPNRPHHHDEKKKHGKQGQQNRNAQKGLHKDWRMWTVVILMLAAMAAYILSGDEALGPGGQPQEAMEAVGE